MLVELARKLSPWAHTKFERWCSLAAVGDLGEEQLSQLAAHVASCSRCRNYLESTMQASLQLMPSLWEKGRPNVSVMPPEGMSARFLQRLQQVESGYGDARAKVELNLPLDSFADRRSTKLHGDSARRAPFSLALRPLPMTVAVILASGLLLTGYYAGMKSRLQRRTASERAVGTTPSLPVAQLPSDAPPDNREILLRSLLADLNRQRSTAATERQAFEKKLAATGAELISLQRDNANTLQERRVADQQTRDELDALRKENESLRQKVAEKETFLALQDRRRKELENELQVARNTLQGQDDQHPAKGPLSDLVTARNLHIVDVYDADGGGQRNAAFGRVFYVEGKALLFYAYDLPDARHTKANIVFHVWGGRAGMKEITHSLGILRNEDAGQRLWTMTFDDAAVLAKINSVFVTAESAGRRDIVPHGKRILYAYIGNPPNHP
jgi:hypothetical protein